MFRRWLCRRRLIWRLRCHGRDGNDHADVDPAHQNFGVVGVEMEAALVGALGPDAVVPMGRCCGCGCRSATGWGPGTGIGAPRDAALTVSRVANRVAVSTPLPADSLTVLVISVLLLVSAVARLRLCGGELVLVVGGWGWPGRQPVEGPRELGRRHFTYRWLRCLLGGLVMPES
jgi:hypothetical protein